MIIDEETINLIDTPDNYSGKVKLIREILADVKKRKNAHYKSFAKYKTTNTITKSFVNGLNGLSVCSIVLTFTPISQSVMIVALCSTSISGLISAVDSAINIEQKVHSHNTSYLQYTDIYRDVSARLLRNGLSSEDLDTLLTEINSRMGLIEDQSLPINI
jgi:hypothetical protein